MAPERLVYKAAARYPRFRFEIGDDSNIELYGNHDGALLSHARDHEEFGPTSRFDLDPAFEDYVQWLEAF